MGKVSIGFRGWRFDESDVFTEDGEFKSLEEIPLEPRRRLVRLLALSDRPCDACWLIHGDENVEESNVPEVVYGEPLAEVLLCPDHEQDFYYWYREDGGSEHRGTEAFQDAFHEWFAAGNRAPEGYVGLEHVETDPDEVPRPEVPDPEDLGVGVSVDEEASLDLRDVDLDGLQADADAPERDDPAGGEGP